MITSRHKNNLFADRIKFRSTYEQFASEGSLYYPTIIAEFRKLLPNYFCLPEGVKPEEDIERILTHKEFLSYVAGLLFFMNHTLTVKMQENRNGNSSRSQPGEDPLSNDAFHKRWTDALLKAKRAYGDYDLQKTHAELLEVDGLLKKGDSAAVDKLEDALRTIKLLEEQISQGKEISGIVPEKNKFLKAMDILERSLQIMMQKAISITGDSRDRSY